MYTDIATDKEIIEHIEELTLDRVMVRKFNGKWKQTIQSDKIGAGYRIFTPGEQI